MSWLVSTPGSHVWSRGWRSTGLSRYLTLEQLTNHVTQHVLQGSVCLVIECLCFLLARIDFHFKKFHLEVQAVF